MMRWISWAPLRALALGAIGLIALASLQGRAAESTTEAGDTPPTVRRLTETQYRQTIADIFGVDIRVAGRFEPDVRVNRLLAIGSSSIGISPAGLEQYDAMARSIAAQVLDDAHRARVMPCEPRKIDSFDRACASKFLGEIGFRLFRRPLAKPELALILSSAQRATTLTGNFYTGVQTALGGMLVAPQFLYRFEQTVPTTDGLTLDAFSKAMRISYFLTNSTPDEELMAAAARGDLDTPAGRAVQVDRLIASPDLERGVRAFFWDMLQFDKFGAMFKDPEIYPAFTPKVASDAQEQTLRMIVNALVVQNGDYRDLFTARDTVATRSLGLLYALPVRSQTGWEPVRFDAGADRAGLLTDLSFLALHSHPGRSSPTIRGKALREIFLCQQVPPPPPDVDFTVVQDTSNTAMKTARERLTAHRTQPTCNGCHQLMDPLGLSLERFDGAGMFRASENGELIDMSGELDGVKFDSAVGLGQAVHDSPRAAQCVVNNAYRYAVGRDVARSERTDVAQLVTAFAEHGYRFPDLMRTIALSDAFYRVSDSSPVRPKPAPVAITRLENPRHARLKDRP